MGLPFFVSRRCTDLADYFWCWIFCSRNLCRFCGITRGLTDFRSASFLPVDCIYTKVFGSVIFKKQSLIIILFEKCYIYIMKRLSRSYTP